MSSQVGGFGEIKKLQISSQSLSQSFFPSRTYTKFSHDTVSLSPSVSLSLSLSLSLSFRSFLFFSFNQLQGSRVHTCCMYACIQN